MPLSHDRPSGTPILGDSPYKVKSGLDVDLRDTSGYPVGLEDLVVFLPIERQFGAPNWSGGLSLSGQRNLVETHRLGPSRA
jgi:hypothetical protein